MSQLYKKMYLSLFHATEEIMEYIFTTMMIPEIYDWNHTREILLKLQAAQQKAEDMYVDAEDD
ncbi:MAG: hypothetical protein K2O18_06620 [Oscillospiraceae bacterium]|nr:hypothetical protein [Oscillospiraceae bacterium]